MNEETKYRVESPEEDDQQEKKGFLRPLPEPTDKVVIQGTGGRARTKLLGFEMYERHRDILVILLMPLLAGLIDANIMGYIVIDALPDSTTFMVIVPMLAALPIGLMAGKTSHGLIGGMLAGIFFVLWMLLFLISPAFVAPDVPIGEFFVSGLVVSSIYFLFVVFGSLLGSLIGAIAREFF